MMNEINVLPHAKAGKLNLLCMNSPDRLAGVSRHADTD